MIEIESLVKRLSSGLCVVSLLVSLLVFPLALEPRS